MPIVVACQCGQQFRAKDEFAGRQLKCPKCGAMLQVPGGAPQPAGGGSDLDALLQMDQTAGMGAAGGFPQQGMPQQGMPQQGMPQQGMPQQGFGQQGFNPMGGYQQPMGGGAFGGMPGGQRKKSSGSPVKLIVGLCAGVVIVISAVVIAIKLSGGGDDSETKTNVAQNDPLPAKPANPSEATPGLNTRISNGTVVKGPGSNTAEDTSTETEDASTDPPADEPFPNGESDLVVATKKWMEKGENVSGLTFTEDEQLEVAAYSWMTYLLPYVGGKELYDEIDFKEEFQRGQNRVICHAEVMQFLNPNQETTRFEGLYFTGMGLTHFVGVSGAEDNRRELAAKLPRSDPRAGMFGYSELAKPEDIKDGASNSLLLIGSEKTAGPWISGGGSTVRGARKGVYPYIGSYYGFWSEGLKKPGALAAFADGSVREVPEDIDPAVFRALSTIAGGEEDVNLDLLGEAADDELPPGIRERVAAEVKKQNASTANKPAGSGGPGSSDASATAPGSGGRPPAPAAAGQGG